MSYTRSVPLQRWLGQRSEVLSAIVRAHSQMGDLSGPGRPLDVSKPLAHAYVIAVVAEFQGFTRDLHDLVAATLLTASSPPPRLAPLLTEAMTNGRQIDRGNADLRAVKVDFGRLGIRPLDLGVHNKRWSAGDSAYLPDIFQLRNALAHGNRRTLRDLRAKGCMTP